MIDVVVVVVVVMVFFFFHNNTQQTKKGNSNGPSLARRPVIALSPTGSLFILLAIIIFFVFGCVFFLV